MKAMSFISVQPIDEHMSGELCVPAKIYCRSRWVMEIDHTVRLINERERVREQQ